MFDRSVFDIGFDQLLHARIAASGGGASEHHSNKVATVAVNRGDQVVPGGLGVTSLYAVNPLDTAEQPVVIADGLAVKAEGTGLEIRIVARKAFLDGAPESGLIPRSGHLFIIGEPGGISVHRPAHAEGVSLARHQGGELL